MSFPIFTKGVNCKQINVFPCSVRISNELGAKRPKAAKFAIIVVLMNSVSIGLFFFVLILALRDVYGVPFTSNPEVVHSIANLAIVFAFSLLLNSIQPVLSGTIYQHTFPGMALQSTY